MLGRGQKKIKHTHFNKMAKSPIWLLNDVAPKEIISRPARMALRLPTHPTLTTNKFNLPTFLYPGSTSSAPLYQLPTCIFVGVPVGPLSAGKNVCQNKHLVPVIDSSNSRELDFPRTSSALEWWNLQWIIAVIGSIPGNSARVLAVRHLKSTINQWSGSLLKSLNRLVTHSAGWWYVGWFCEDLQAFSLSPMYS